jgi:hypothetical protein
VSVIIWEITPTSCFLFYIESNNKMADAQAPDVGLVL